MSINLKNMALGLLRFKLGEHSSLIIFSFIVGLLAALANIVFRSTMEFVHEVIFVGGSHLLNIQFDEYNLSRLLIPLLPMTGALLLIPFSKAFPGEVNGYAFHKFIEIVNIKGGVVRMRNLFIKTIGPALTIGSGGSAGIEGPIAIIGGTVGSGIGQVFKVSGNQMKLLIAAGSAGAIASTFNAPIAGVMFAMEIVLLGNYELTSFAAIVISSGIATVVSRSYYGATPAFIVPQYELKTLYEIPLYVVLGLLVGGLAVLYIRIFYTIRDKFNELRINPQMKPVLGAFMVGVMAIALPQVMGNGYEHITDMLAGRLAFSVVLMLVIFKIFATSITLGSGGAGGVFAPALFIGAMIGGSFGFVVNALFPELTASPGAYATVGIGSFLAAATHAPLTGIFLLFEMTGNYKIIVPVMFSAIIGTVVATRMYGDSIDTVDLTRRGINLHAGRESSVMSTIKVKDVMSRDFATIKADASLKKLVNIMINKEKFYIPVVDDSKLLVGVISIQDIRPVLYEEYIMSIVNAGDLATEDVQVLKPDDNLNTAMEYFSIKDLDELPVVDPEKPRKVIGMLRRSAVMSAYNKEVLRKGASTDLGPFVPLPSARKGGPPEKPIM